jgi:two-component system, OmpR family, sensor histidine kinase KdpD
MFDEGRRRKERAQDVVIGAIQRDVTPDVGEIVSGIEVIPPVDGAIDLVALFRRHPEVCLIDELANDNPPGSRNRQRWQDLQELLDRGIDVITAVNLQHIREQQDAVERITGKRTPQSVPEEFLKEADEIEVVDAPPDILLGRTGNSGIPAARQLAELREHEQHLRRLIGDYVNYHHEDRIHDSLEKDTPNRRTVEPKAAAKATVISMPRLGGLHHRYAWREAA